MLEPCKPRNISNWPGIGVGCKTLHEILHVAMKDVGQNLARNVILCSAFRLQIGLVLTLVIAILGKDLGNCVFHRRHIVIPEKACLKMKNHLSFIRGSLVAITRTIADSQFELAFALIYFRSEERRVGKECRSRW